MRRCLSLSCAPSLPAGGQEGAFESLAINVIKHMACHLHPICSTFLSCFRLSGRTCRIDRLKYSLQISTQPFPPSPFLRYGIVHAKASANQLSLVTHSQGICRASPRLAHDSVDSAGFPSLCWNSGLQFHFLHSNRNIS